jgi:integrase
MSAHDLRRGSAKDAARLDPTEMKTANAGTARLLGHRNTNMQQRIYNNIEDEAINVRKKDIKPGRTEDRALYTATAYIPPKFG